jgi:hypothetical protein
MNFFSPGVRTRNISVCDGSSEEPKSPAALVPLLQVQKPSVCPIWRRNPFSGMADASIVSACSARSPVRLPPNLLVPQPPAAHGGGWFLVTKPRCKPCDDKATYIRCVRCVSKVSQTLVCAQPVFDMSVRNIPDAVLSNKRSIRMLSLEPGEGSDPLIGSLTSVDVDHAGAYEPLSYVWSDPTRSHSILCQGVRIGLTGSLYHALRRVRLPNDRRRIWADQICIDQDNLVERSQQVQFMNTIYRNARGVLVWLGNDDRNEAAVAFGFVRELAAVFQDDSKHTRFYKDHVEDLDGRSGDGEQWAPLKALTRLLWVSTLSPHWLYLSDSTTTDANIHVCSSRGPGSYRRSEQRQVPFYFGALPRSTGTRCMSLVKTLQRTTTCERSST